MTPAQYLAAHLLPVDYFNVVASGDGAVVLGPYDGRLIGACVQLDDGGWLAFSRFRGRRKAAIVATGADAAQRLVAFIDSAWDK